MKTILILVLLGLHVGLCAQKHIEVKASLEMNGYWGEGVPCFKVEVKNLTDSTLMIINRSEYWGDEVFNPVNSYFVVDYVLKNGEPGVISGIPLMINKDKHITMVNARQSIKNEFKALSIRGLTGFSGIFPSDFDLSKVAKVRFRLVKVLYGIRFGSGPYSNTEHASNWVKLKKREIRHRKKDNCAYYIPG